MIWPGSTGILIEEESVKVELSWSPVIFGIFFIAYSRDARPCWGGVGAGGHKRMKLYMNPHFSFLFFF